MGSPQSERADDIPGDPPWWMASGTAVMGLVVFVVIGEVNGVNMPWWDEGRALWARGCVGAGSTGG